MFLSQLTVSNRLWQPLRGKNTVDLVVVGAILELQDVSDPLLYWPARVVQNVGGRLRLRYAGLSEDQQARDTWLFYLDVRLRPLGWALENHLSLEPPTGDHLIKRFGVSLAMVTRRNKQQSDFRHLSSALCSLKSATEWQQAVEEAQLDGQKNPLPLEVFKVSRRRRARVLSFFFIYT